MDDVTNNMLFEQLKIVQLELTAARERDAELLRHLTIMEVSLRNRLDRIERQLAEEAVVSSHINTNSG